MSVLGPLTLIDNRFPTGISPALLATLARETGLSQEAAVAQAARVVGEKNEEILSRYQGIARLTSSRELIYRAGTGVRGTAKKSVELARNRAVRGAEAGHMLPRDDYDTGVDFTDEFMRRGNAAAYINALQQTVDEWENTVDAEMITRMLTTTERALDSSGYSVGWAIGTGTNVNFVPPQYRGTLFTTSHSHYNVQNTGSGGTWALGVEECFKDLREHGINDELVMLVGPDNVDDVTGLAGFVDLESPRVVVNTANTNAPARYVESEVLLSDSGVPGNAFGWVKVKGYGIAKVYLHSRIPDGYAFFTKSYGNLHPKNGLAIYTENPEGFGLNIEPEYRMTPQHKLNHIRLYGTHGIGVNDRLNGVALYVGASASYVNPTIS